MNVSIPANLALLGMAKAGASADRDRGCGRRQRVEVLVAFDSLPPHQVPLSVGFSGQEYWSG